MREKSRNRSRLLSSVAEMDGPIAVEAEPVATRRSAVRPALDRQLWLRIALSAGGVWLATRIAYAVFTYFTISLNSLGAFSGSLLRAWDQYDTHWYLLISRLGYFNPGASAFFPLYPGLIGAVSALLGHAQGPVWPAPDSVRLLVALGIANIFTLAGFVGLALLAVHEYRDEIDPSRVVLVAAAFPFAFFFAAAYSEGLFLAAAVFALYCARRGAWKWAAAAAFAAGLTRPTAVALVLPLAWEYGRQHGWWSRRNTQERPFGVRNLLEAFMAAGAAPASIALYGAFLWQRFGSPLIWFKVQAEDWHRQPIPVWTTMAGLGHRVLAFPPFSGAEAQLLLNLLPLLLCLMVVVVAFRQMPFAFILYTVGLCYLSVSSPILSKDELIESTGRFLTVAFPVFIILARWMTRWPVVGQAWVSAGFLLQAALMITFFAGRWVA